MSVKYVLKLYIVGSSPSSRAALKNLKDIISVYDNKQIRLKVIDVSKYPQLAETDKILAIPTLIREQPLPVRKIIGNLSQKDKILSGLDILALDKRTTVNK